MNINKFTEKAQEAVVDGAEPRRRATTIRRSRPSTCSSRWSSSRAASCRRSCARSASTLPGSPARRAACSGALPQAYGADVRLSPRMNAGLRLGAGRGAAAAGRVRQHRASARRAGDRDRPLPRRAAAAAQGATKDALYAAMTQVRGNQRVTSQNPEATYEALDPLRPRPHRAGAQRQARSGDRPRRGGPPRHPGAVAPHQEQPGADRRARRRQDRHRRRAGAAHRPRRRARKG